MISDMCDCYDWEEIMEPEEEQEEVIIQEVRTPKKVRKQ